MGGAKKRSYEGRDREFMGVAVLRLDSPGDATAPSRMDARLSQALFPESPCLPAMPAPSIVPSIAKKSRFRSSPLVVQRDSSGLSTTRPMSEFNSGSLTG